MAGAATILALAGYTGWQLLFRTTYSYATSQYPFDDADEWRYTACSRLLVHGYSLFTQIYSAQPPLYFLSLSASMRLFGDTIDGARGVGIVCGVVALVATGVIAWQVGGPLAAGVATPVMAISPPFLLYSHAVEAEVPMMTLVTVAIACALYYRRSGRIWALILAALVLDSALLTKLFAVEALLPIAFILVSRHKTVRSFLVAMAAFTAGVVMPVMVELLFFAQPEQWNQVFSLHTSAAGAALPDVNSPVQIIWQFLAFDRGLTCLAVAGLAVLFAAGRLWQLLFCLSWLGGQIVMLLVFHPLFPHHPAILCTSLAVSAGVGAQAAVAEWNRSTGVRRTAIVAAAAAYVAFLPRLVRLDRHTLVQTSLSDITVLARYVDRTTAPGTFVAVDNLQIADRADRLVPPPLCDPSNVRFHAGQLTARTLIEATQTYRANLVVPLGNYNLAPAYIRWVRLHYREVHVPGGGTVYRRQWEYR